MNMAKDSNTTFPKRKSGTVENVVEIILLTITADISGTKTGECVRQNDVKLLVNDTFFCI
jgi:hypothetical protein